MNMTDNEKVIRQLYRITSKHEHGFARQMRELLTMGCERLGLEIGILAQIDHDRYRVVHQVSPDQVPLEDEVRFHLPDTYCAVTIAANQPVGYEHVGESDIRNHPAYAAFELEAYIGIPITVDGELYGTLNFSSPYPRARKFSEIDIDALKIMAIWIEGEISRLRAQQHIMQQARELAAINRQLLAMTRTDSLTQVGNRRSFFEELEHHLMLAQRVSMPLSVVIFDLDDFKSFNDNYGHVAGDNALIAVAKTAADLARATDYVARYGGEEFLVMLPDTGRENAVSSAERLRQAIVAIGSLARTVSASFGVSTFEPGRHRLTDFSALSTRLVEEADQALYRSKEGGKNRVDHFETMTPARAASA